MSTALFDTDALARTAIRESLDECLFVEAGAGTGKTTELVRRVVALVTEAAIPISAIAAITFTEKAAAELRDRVRSALDRLARSGEPGHELARAALDAIDDAAIGTLHGFAQRLLVEHPVEVGLPPRVEILDEVASQLAFDERWTRVYDDLMNDPDFERTVSIGIGLGLQARHLRELAQLADDNWDLVGERIVLEPPEPPTLDLAPLVDEIRACIDERHACRTDDDTMVAYLATLVDYAERLDGAVDDLEAMELLSAEQPTFRAGNKGRKDNWPDIAALREHIAGCATRRAALIESVRDPALRRLTWFVARRCLDAAGDRRGEGTLEFHDLLVLSRALLRDPVHGPEVRAALARRYQRVLLDEFQDTDPIQVELAVLLTNDDADAGERPWELVRPEPGRLFAVGDPKQSIYRFRRADIAMYLTARRSLGAREIELSNNWRTTEPIIDWINHVFGQLIQFQDGMQPEYRRLVANRPAAPVGPSVGLLGPVAHSDAPKAAELRTREADEVVATISTALADGWSVWEGSSETGGWRPARPGDIAILLPARTSLRFLEERLDQAGIPYRAETSSLVYTTREVRELVMALRAIDDPTDELAIVSTLRTSLYGCGDDDLFEYRVEHGGRWSLHAPRPDGLAPDHPVLVGLDHLRTLHDARHWVAPSELFDRLVRDRRVLEQGFATGRPRDLWRRVRFVGDQARAFADAGGGTLRDFLRWVAMQSAEGARVVESVLPETDDDAVRILTIHGAKGLEFPITIMSGLTTRPEGHKGGVRLAFPADEDFVVRFGTNLVSSAFERFVPIDEQFDFEERLRLLYVAATRARDHLVVSLHRSIKDEPADTRRRTYAGLLAAANEAGDAPNADRASAITFTEVPFARTESTTPDGATLDLASWEAEVADVLAAARVPRSWSATAIARHAAPGPAGAEPPVPELSAPEIPTPEPLDPGLDKDARDLELPAWQRGRYGTAIGRAVHAVLQTIDLDFGDLDEGDAPELHAAVAAQAASEGVAGAEARIAALVRSALRSATVRAAVASGELWRESYVATTVGDRVIEGYVDLIYRRPDGLVVVDYKTDAFGSEADLDVKLDRYRLQGATYALAVAQATGEQVVDVVFVFCTEGDPHERSVPDLHSAIAEVRDIVEVAR